MTRILSAFNLLKRVGFALLLLGATIGFCEWDTDPRNPTYHWGTSTDPSIISDGLGGAFFSFSILGNYWPHIGHIDAQGNQTFPIGSHPYEYLISIDQAQYAGTPIGATLVRSGPPGTVIAVHERGLNNQYGGFVFSQFDVNGPSGFGSVGYVGQDYRLFSLQSDDDHGWATLAGDSEGGIHFVMRGPQIDGLFTKYYNHLNSEGAFTHEWPGLPLPRTEGWGAYVFEDGFGGAFLVQYRAAHRGDSLIGQHFSSNGYPQWEPNGRLISPLLPGLWSQYDLMSPGKLIFWAREEVTEDSFAHYGYCIDTTGQMVWGDDGIVFEHEGSEVAYLTPDEVGGFFYFSFFPAGYGNGGHYDGNGQLFAVAPWYSVSADYPDGLGGAYNLRPVNDVPPLDTLRFDYERLNSDLILLWENATTVLDVPSWYFGHVATPDGQNGIIGLASTNQGMVFYHLNPDGSLGPNLGNIYEPMPYLTKIDLISTYPNPFNGMLNVNFSIETWHKGRLMVYDVLGRIVHSQPIETSGQVSLSSDAWAAGSYLICVESVVNDSPIRSGVNRVLLLK